VTPATALAGTIHLGGAAASPVNVAIDAAGRSWTSQRRQLAQASRHQRQRQCHLAVSFDATGLAVGDYSSTLIVSASDGQSVTLAATLTVQLQRPGQLQRPDFQCHQWRADTGPEHHHRHGRQGQRQLSASASVAWLSVSPSSGTTPASMALTVDPRVGTLASGSYSNTPSLAAPA
jgi:hypothetical protein